MRQKSGHRAILDQGWDEFRRQLAYKMEWNDDMLLATPPYHTSQTSPDEGIGGAATVRTSPLQQQVTPNPTKSRTSSDWRASSELVAIQIPSALLSFWITSFNTKAGVTTNEFMPSFRFQCSNAAAIVSRSTVNPSSTHRLRHSAAALAVPS